MTLLKRITFFKYISSIPKKYFIFVFFIVLHLFIFNINTAEWGDSYRILRASEFIRQGTYPSDEKRPPLFSMVLAVRPAQVDAVTWGRGVMFVFSIFAFLIFDKLVSFYFKEEKYRLISLILFVLNPVYLYWSLRIMADVPFSVLVLLVFYLLTKWKDSLSLLKSILLGLLVGLAILTRFEGYLLLISVLFGVLFIGHELSFSSFKLKVLFGILLKRIKFLVLLGLTTLIVISPWLVYRNPLTSKYFSETSGRTYDLKMIWIYFSSLLYLFGFSSAFYFIFSSVFSNSRTALKSLKDNIGVSLFIILELILILVWPAAIPRLFVSIIPFLIILLVLSYQDYESRIGEKRSLDLSSVGMLVLLLLFYVSSQLLLKLQFLIVVRWVFILIAGLQASSIVFLLTKRNTLFYITCITSLFIWSLSTIYNHQYIYSAIKQVSMYAQENLGGKIVFNDTTSVADWYLNYDKPKTNLSGEYLNLSEGKNYSYFYLSANKVAYVITTNEDGAGFNSQIEKVNYLKLVKDFRYNIKDTVFSATVYKFIGGVVK